MKSLIIRNVSYNFLNNFSGILFTLLATPYLTRTLGAEGMGSYALLMAIIAFYLTFSYFGLPFFGQRKVSSTNNSDRRKISSEIIAFSVYTYLISSMIFLPIGFFFYKELFFEFLILSLVPLINFISAEWYFQGTEKFRYIFWRGLLTRIICFCLMVAFVKDTKDLWIYCILSVFIMTGGSILNVFYSSQYLNIKEYFKHLDFINIKKTFFLTISFFSIDMFSKAFGNAEILILDFFTDQQEIGIYSIYLKISLLFVYFAQILSITILPRVSNYLMTSNKKIEIFQLALEVTYLYLILITVFLFFFGNEIILIFAGKEFITNPNLIYFFIPFILFNSGNALISNIYLIPNHLEKNYLIATAVSSIILIILTILFAEYYGIYGAALALTTSSLVQLLINFLSIRSSEYREQFKLVPIFLLFIVSVVSFNFKILNFGIAYSIIFFIAFSILTIMWFFNTTLKNKLK